MLSYRGFDLDVTTFDFLGIISNLIKCFLLIIYYHVVARPKTVDEDDAQQKPRKINESSSPPSNPFSIMTAGFIETTRNNVQQ